MDNTEVTQSASEVLNQQLYDLKREVARLTLLERDYITEIESLQTKHAKDKREWQNKVNALEEEKRLIEQTKTKAIEEVEAVLYTKCEELEALKDNLGSSSKNQSIVDYSNEVQELTNKIQDLELQISKLKEENGIMRECALNFEKDIQTYEGAMNTLKDEYNSLLETYQQKTEDLNESKRLVETLQEELIMTKTELDLTKNKPIESNGQGNSLFAEVDEKRLQLQTKVNMMKTHYEEMKQQINRLESQVFEMRVENGTLKQNWEKEIEERSNDKYDFEESYKVRINLLESLINDYKKELDSRPLVSTKTMKQEELTFIEYRIELKNKEIDKLLEKINKTSISNMLLTERNREILKEASTWHFKFVKAKEDLEIKDETIKKLEGQIRELEIAEIVTERCVESPPLISCGKFNRNESYIDMSRYKKRTGSFLQENKNICTEINQSDKENQTGNGNVKKQVQFTAETKDNQPKERLRRGGRVIVCEPTVLKKREF